MKKISLLITAVMLFTFNNCALAETPLGKSIEIYTEQINSGSANADIYNKRGSLLFLNNDNQGAIADFTKAIELSPQNAELYLNRGYVKQKIKDKKGAEEDYSSAIKLNPRFAEAYNNRGVVRASMDDIKGAMSDYALALEINSKYADAYYNRANLKSQQGDNLGALEDFNKAIEINPKDAEAYNNRGVIKRRLKMDIGALSDYSQAIALNPKDSIAYVNRGHLKNFYYDSEGASVDINKALALAEKQHFIKNASPLFSKENIIALGSEMEGNKPKKNNETVAMETEKKSQPAHSKPVIQKEKVYETPITIASFTRAKDAIEAKNKALALANSSKEQNTKISSSAVSKPSDLGTTKNNENKVKPKAVSSTPQKLSENKITASVSAVKTIDNKLSPQDKTKQNLFVKSEEVKLAQSYYIRGLQKCVMRDLQGAIADLSKAIEANSKYADAYFYRAAIKKELGDMEGFRKDYASAIQINPSLQAFNDNNAPSLIQG